MRIDSCTQHPPPPIPTRPRWGGLGWGRVEWGGVVRSTRLRGKSPGTDNTMTLYDEHGELWNHNTATIPTSTNIISTKWFIGAFRDQSI